MPVRNHITRIKSADTVAKESETVARKTTGEVKKADPKNAEEVIRENIKASIGPNTVLDTEEKRVLEGGKPSESVLKEQEKELKAETGDKPAEEGLSVAHPASSKQADGAEVKTDADPKVANKKK